MLLTALNLLNMKLDSRILDLGIDTIASANLANSNRMLESGLRVDDIDFPVDRLSVAPSYKKHLASLEAYAHRLEIYAETERTRSLSLSFGSLFAALAMLCASILNKRKND
jgi:hypothetical protein